MTRDDTGTKLLSNPPGKATLNRRAFLATGLAAGTVLSGATARAASPENQAPNVPEWSQYLGASVEDAPYGSPSEFESAARKMPARAKGFRYCPLSTNSSRVCFPSRSRSLAPSNRIKFSPFVIGQQGKDPCIRTGVVWRRTKRGVWRCDGL